MKSLKPFTPLIIGLILGAALAMPLAYRHWLAHGIRQQTRKDVEQYRQETEALLKKIKDGG